jgi:hypothetical protein
MPRAGRRTAARARRSRRRADRFRWPPSIPGVAPSRTDGAPVRPQPLRNCSWHCPEDTKPRRAGDHPRDQPPNMATLCSATNCSTWQLSVQGWIGVWARKQVIQPLRLRSSSRAARFARRPPRQRRGRCAWTATSPRDASILAPDRLLDLLTCAVGASGHS